LNPRWLAGVSAIARNGLGANSVCKFARVRGVLPAGTTLRGYERKSILGQGAFGITYRARDTTLHHHL
jgi:hypothetical protein